MVVNELARDLGVSEATVRNDLKILEEDGLLERTHGGAVLPKPPQNEYTFHVRSTINPDEKNAIGKAALQFIRSGQCIILDGSSTALALAKQLTSFDYLTVVTNGLLTAQELAQNPRINVIVVGGVLRVGSTSLEGLLGRDLLSQIHADIFFTSAHGFTMENGLMDFNVYEVELKKLFIASVDKVVALLDHTKIGRRSIATFATTDQIHTLITDSAADQNYLRDANFEVVIAK